MALVHSLEILEKMEDMWKRKLSLPYSELSINTGNTSVFVEDGREFTIFFLTFTLLSANRHPPLCCRLDTSLLSTAQQGAERRSARKVISFNISHFFL